MRKGLIDGLQKVKNLKRIGIFGGTFDPVHLGHLVCAEQVGESIGLDAVLFVPCAIPPHKPGYIPAPSSDRLMMLELATQDNPRFVVSDIEIERGGVSYTVDTITELRKHLGGLREIWLVLGLDSYLEMGTWRQPDEIASQCLIAVAGRPGYTIPADARFRSRTRFIGISGIDISSSWLRKRIAEGKSIKYLVPGKVETYIREHDLYR